MSQVSRAANFVFRSQDINIINADAVGRIHVLGRDSVVTQCPDAGPGCTAEAALRAPTVVDRSLLLALQTSAPYPGVL